MIFSIAGVIVGFLVGCVIIVIKLWWQNKQGVAFHEALVADSECTDHSIWHLTWPKVDDEWTGVVNIVCDNCNHTERMPSCWSLSDLLRV